jgi:hypothetical protein
MIRTCWVLVAAAAAILWIGTGSARAGDETLKLDLNEGKEAATTNLLGSDNEAETVLVGHGGHAHGGHVHAGHFHGGHFHGGHVHASHFHGGHVHASHFHGGHVHGGHFHTGHFHHGHFHHGGAFVSVGVGFGNYPGYYYPSYDPYYYPAYYYSSSVYSPPVYYPSGVYGAPSVYYTPAYCDYPLGYGLSNGGATLATPERSIMAQASGPEASIPMSRPAPNDGTNPYEGGPANPVPMPQAEPRPNRKARPTHAPDGRLAVIESKAPTYRYPAYGEEQAEPRPNRKAGPTRAPDGRLAVIESKALKYRYPAYGDNSVARKVDADRQVAAKPAE